MFSTGRLATLVGMSSPSPRSARRRTVHAVCTTGSRFGWAVCLTAWQMGLAVQARVGNRIRIVVAESGTQDGHEVNAVEQLRTTTFRLAVEGCSAKRSLEELSRVEAGGSGATASPGPSLTILDLNDSGQVETASLNAPAAIQLSHGRGATPRNKPVGFSEVESMIAVTTDHAVLALSPSAAREVTTDYLNAVAAMTPSFSDPCRFRDDLLHLVGEQAPLLPAPPMAVLFRPGDR